MNGMFTRYKAFDFSQPSKPQISFWDILNDEQKFKTAWHTIFKFFKI